MASRLHPLRDRRQERQRGHGLGRGLRGAGRNTQRQHAELARERAGRDDPVGRDVVGTGRTGGDDAQQQRLSHVRFVHKLHGQFRCRHRERGPAGPPGRSSGQRSERAARQALGAHGVRARARCTGAAGTGPGCRVRRGPGPQQAFELGFLLRVEQPGGGAYRPVLGHPDRVVPVKAVSGHRGRVDEAARSGRHGGVEDIERAVDVDRPDRLTWRGTGHLERQVDHDVRAAERVAQQPGVAHVAPPVVRLRPAVRGGVERAPCDACHVRHPVVGLKQRHEAESQGAGRPGHRDRQSSPRLRHVSHPLTAHQNRGQRKPAAPPRGTTVGLSAKQ